MMSVDFVAVLASGQPLSGMTRMSSAPRAARAEVVHPDVQFISSLLQSIKLGQSEWAGTCREVTSSYLSSNASVVALV